MGEEVVQSVAYYIRKELDNYCGGALEAASNTAYNATKALGRLVELLADRGLLSAAEVVEVAGGYCPGAELVEGEGGSR